MKHNEQVAVREQQELYIAKFKELMEKVKKNELGFDELLRFTEQIPFENIRMICSTYCINLKKELKINEKYNFTIII